MHIPFRSGPSFYDTRVRSKYQNDVYKTWFRNMCTKHDYYKRRETVAHEHPTYTIGMHHTPYTIDMYIIHHTTHKGEKDTPQESV